jgi:hypothetical protein
MSITHTSIPDGLGDSFKKGWKEYYFSFMKKHFEKS